MTRCAAEHQLLTHAARNTCDNLSYQEVNVKCVIFTRLFNYVLKEILYFLLEE